MTQDLTKNSQFEEDIDLREIIKRGDTWYTFYAMDWICQIDFFNKFITFNLSIF